MPVGSFLSVCWWFIPFTVDVQMRQLVPSPGVLGSGGSGMPLGYEMGVEAAHNHSWSLGSLRWGLVTIPGVQEGGGGGPSSVLGSKWVASEACDYSLGPGVRCWGPTSTPASGQVVAVASDHS